MIGGATNAGSHRCEIAPQYRQTVHEMMHKDTDNFLSR
jgi:hypothetical protein